ncbi:hypothetical protein HZS_1055, partial [Henneguya salminicola]
NGVTCDQCLIFEYNLSVFWAKFFVKKKRGEAHKKPKEILAMLIRKRVLYKTEGKAFITTTISIHNKAQRSFSSPYTAFLWTIAQIVSNMILL